MLYLSEEKDKIASSLVYLMYNVIPYLKNHGWVLPSLNLRHRDLSGH